MAEPDFAAVTARQRERVVGGRLQPGRADDHGGRRAPGRRRRSGARAPRPGRRVRQRATSALVAARRFYRGDGPRLRRANLLEPRGVRAAAEGTADRLRRGRRPGAAVRRRLVRRRSLRLRRSCSHPTRRRRRRAPPRLPARRDDRAGQLDPRQLRRRRCSSRPPRPSCRPRPAWRRRGGGGPGGAPRPARGRRGRRAARRGPSTSASPPRTAMVDAVPGVLRPDGHGLPGRRRARAPSSTPRCSRRHRRLRPRRGRHVQAGVRLRARSSRPGRPG